MSRLLRRRDALIAFAGFVAAACGARRSRISDASAATCVLTPEVTEGPYYVANHLTRRDITEGRPGVPLALRLIVQDASTCRPIKNADVELWHADAGGVYSGVAGNSGHFLRGHQRSDASGVVRFDTIYPGWYRGRTPHIHIKVHVGGDEVHTGQLFFADATSAAVYRTARYRSHGEADTTNGEDTIYAQAGRGRSRLRLSRRSGGYRGTITLGVRT